MNKDALQELEVKVAFLEHALTKLSDEYYEQQQELDKLKISYLSLSEKVNSGGGDDGGQDFQQDETPPHY